MARKYNYVEGASMDMHYLLQMFRTESVLVYCGKRRLTRAQYQEYFKRSLVQPKVKAAVKEFLIHARDEIDRILKEEE